MVLHIMVQAVLHPGRRIGHRWQTQREEHRCFPSPHIEWLSIIEFQRDVWGLLGTAFQYPDQLSAASIPQTHRYGAFIILDPLRHRSGGAACDRS